jgi:predicted nucleic acid-binding protein
LNEIVFVDTNVLLYEWDNVAVAKQARANEWIQRLFAARTGRLSFQVLAEFYRGATQKLHMKPDAAEKYARTFFPWNPVTVDEAVLENAWRAQRRFRLSWWDALIVAAARRAECRTLLSEGFQAGQDFDGLVVVNPFATAPTPAA